MRDFLGTCALILLSGTLAAQAPEARQSITLTGATLSGACPVGFSARHANSGMMVNVSPATKPHGGAYDLHFTPRDGEAMIEARVTLHGLSGHHVLPAGDPSAVTSWESSEVFNLALRADPSHLFTSVVYLKTLTGVTSVELNEITYANGTKWHEVTGSPCAIRPDGFTLITSR